MSSSVLVVAPSGAVDPEEARLLEVIVAGRRAATSLTDETAPERRRDLEAAVRAAEDARSLLIQAHQGLVAKVAYRYRHEMVGSTLIGPADDDPSQITGKRLALQAVHELLDELPDRQRFVIRRRYGLGSAPERLTDIAETLGVTASRVCQIERDALQRLRRLAAGRGELLAA